MILTTIAIQRPGEIFSAKPLGILNIQEYKIGHRIELPILNIHLKSVKHEYEIDVEMLKY